MTENYKHSINKPFIYVVSNKGDMDKFFATISSQISSIDIENVSNIDSSELNQENHEVSNMHKSAITGLGLLVALLGGALPGVLSLLAAAAATGVTLAQIVSTKDESSDKNAKEATNATQSITKHFAEQNLLGTKQLIEEICFFEIPQELKFPPGHPFPDKLYRRHPLKNKSNLIIPIEAYYSVLFDEREGELLRILADLGATKISILEESSNSLERNLGAEVAVTSQIEAQTKVNTEDKFLDMQRREFEYLGRHWTSNMEFEQEKYSWLDYEPDWEVIVHGRLVNGLLSAQIELTKDISHHLDAQLGFAEELFKQLNINIGAKLAKANLQKRRFFVEFAGKANTEEG
jgi:hypothetical protein